MVDIVIIDSAVPAAVSASENALDVCTVQVADPGAGGAPAYAIAGGADADLFAIDAATGLLRFRAAPDFESPADAGADNVYDVTVSAMVDGVTTLQTLAVSVTGVNEVPAITSNGGAASVALTLAENTAAVTTVIGADPDAGTTLTYAIAGGADADRFVIDSVTGALRFITAPDFEAPADAGANNVYDVVVSASDGALVTTQALAITITDANDAPVITSSGGGDAATVGLVENATVVTLVRATDADPGTTLTYAIVGGADAALFTIDPANGLLRFLSGPDYENPADADRNNVYDVVVSASDGTLADTQAITVTVANGNEAPVITSGGGGSKAALSVVDGTTAVTRVVATDGDAGTTLTYTITGGNDAALFEIDEDTGALRFKAAPDFAAPSDTNRNNVYDLIVTVSDGTLSDAQALAVTVTGAAVGAVITGTGNNDNLTGTVGNDTIDGGRGRDRMEGKAGDDLYIVDNSGDRVDEGAGGGVDTVRTGLGSYKMDRNVENLVLTGTIAHKATGNELANRITGAAGADTLDGGAGADVMEGAAGNDSYRVDNTGDTIVELAGGGTDSVSADVSYTLGANIENLTLRSSRTAIQATGNDLANVLIGNAESNTISGRGGDDRIVGGRGMDILTGGAGADTFVFDTKPGKSNVDTITDFTHGVDHLAFAKAMFPAFEAAGAVDPAVFWSGAGVNTAHDADDRFIYNTTTGYLWYDADGTGKTKPVMVATLQGHPDLSAADLLII